MTCQQGPVAPSWEGFYLNSPFLLTDLWVLPASSHPYISTMAPREQSHLPCGLCGSSSLSLPYKRTMARGALIKAERAVCTSGKVPDVENVLLLEDEYRRDHKRSIFTPENTARRDSDFYLPIMKTFISISKFRAVRFCSKRHAISLPES